MIVVISQLVNRKGVKKEDDCLIFIDYHSRVPIYEQIKEQIIMLINTGIYKPNEQLPSIRSLSNELNINVNTIKRAFADLEKDGVTYSAQGRGIFVSENPIGNSKIVAGAIEDIRIALTSGKAKGVTREDLQSLIEEIYRAGEKND